MSEKCEKCAGLEERSAHLEAKLKEMGEELVAARDLTNQLKGQVLALKAELSEYYAQVIANQQREVETLKSELARGERGS